jgi:hypothetical protein
LSAKSKARTRPSESRRSDRQGPANRTPSGMVSHPAPALEEADFPGCRCRQRLSRIPPGRLPGRPRHREPARPVSPVSCDLSLCFPGLFRWYQFAGSANTPKPARAFRIRAMSTDLTDLAWSLLVINASERHLWPENGFSIAPCAAVIWPPAARGRPDKNNVPNRHPCSGRSSFRGGASADRRGRGRRERRPPA